MRASTKLSILFIITTVINTAQAITFRPSIDESEWVLESSKFECKL